MSAFWERAVKDTAKGEIKDGETRYVMLRTDVVAAMVNQLSEQTRGELLESFAKAVEEHGGKSLARYFDMVNGDVDQLLDTVAATAAALGWGSWRFSRVDNGLVLEVKNSPYATFNAPIDANCCAPIMGMFTALAKMILGEVISNERSCKSANGDSCVFQAVKIR